MRRILTDEEFNRMAIEYSKVKYECKKCGHKVVIPDWVDKNLCRYCGNFVFKDEKSEFEYRLKEKIRRR